MQPTKEIFEGATKENLRTYQRKSKYEREPVLAKLLTLFGYWSNQVEKLIALVYRFIIKNFMNLMKLLDGCLQTFTSYF